MEFGCLKSISHWIFPTFHTQLISIKPFCGLKCGSCSWVWWAVLVSLSVFCVNTLELIITNIFVCRVISIFHGFCFVYVDEKTWTKSAGCLANVEVTVISENLFAHLERIVQSSSFQFNPKYSMLTEFGASSWIVITKLSELILHLILLSKQTEWMYETILNI